MLNSSVYKFLLFYVSVLLSLSSFSPKNNANEHAKRERKRQRKKIAPIRRIMDEKSAESKYRKSRSSAWVNEFLAQNEMNAHRTDKQQQKRETKALKCEWITWKSDRERGRRKEKSGEIHCLIERDWPRPAAAEAVCVCIKMKMLNIFRQHRVV